MWTIRPLNIYLERRDLVIRDVTLRVSSSDTNDITKTDLNERRRQKKAGVLRQRFRTSIPPPPRRRAFVHSKRIQREADAPLCDQDIEHVTEQRQFKTNRILLTGVFPTRHLQIAADRGSQILTLQTSAANE